MTEETGPTGPLLHGRAVAREPHSLSHCDEQSIDTSADRRQTMSFPAYNDADHDALSPSSWTTIEIESEETRRLHDSIFAAAELLKRDSSGVAAECAIPDQHFDGDFQLAGVHHGCFELAPAPSHQWLPALQTSMTRPQLADIDEWFGLGTMLKLGAVAGLAVGVAFTTLSTAPPAGIAVASQPTQSPIFSMAALSGLAQISAAQAKVQSTTSLSPPASSPAASSPAALTSASAVLEAAQTSVDLAAASPAPSAAPVPAANVVAPAAAADMVPPHASEIPPPAPAAAVPPPRSPTAPALARDELAALLKRGRSLLAAGDIPSARLILTRLAETGEAEASLLLAGTFDPAELARLHVIGAEPNVAQARAWYTKAAEQGSLEGSRRLQRLALR
jgi:hypothetical protein